VRNRKKKVRVKTLKETSSTREKEAKRRRLNVIELDKDENGRRRKGRCNVVYVYFPDI